MSVKAVQSKGSVHICSLSKLRLVPKDNNYLFLVTRGTRKIKGVRQTYELAPSPQLFSQYLSEWKNSPPCEWWESYSKLYLEELNYNFINKLTVGIDEGKDITLICFCGDENRCHRKILKGIFDKLGYKTISY